MKVVIDTNVIVSGLLKPNSNPSQILNLFLNDQIQLLYDFRIIEEYENVLLRNKFKFKKEDILVLMDFLKNEEIFTPANPIEIHFTDIEDKKFYEVALTGNADFLVTGNLIHFPKSKLIVSPATFIRNRTK
ncbi:MAG: putative toxin-antitoxin system toxin component, PIN family [Bacteroidales bacterium]|nr:putative toxin-antitoxin system toxin component, PIN family [Bacteroidales bacterium]